MSTTDKPSTSRSRRAFLRTGGGLALASALPLSLPPATGNAAAGILTRPIPSTGEHIPVLGMGTWITFDVGGSPVRRARRVEVLEEFFRRGGGMIDSSPMYGSAQDVLGHCLEQVADRRGLFSATKVWIIGKGIGIRQMETSRRLWRVPRFDLMQIHNMLDWETHLDTLQEWKAEGRIRYLGITTSHGRRHRALEKALETETFDFVQLTYNLVDREAERRLLPLAAERGVAVIANRPFRRGALFDRYARQPLPAWAAEFDAANWAQFFLKFIVAHPAITCAIPATSQATHMAENMGAAYGALPDPELRARMVRHLLR